MNARMGSFFNSHQGAAAVVSFASQVNHVSVASSRTSIRGSLAAIALATAAFIGIVSPANAGEPPYLKLAEAFGTPKLARSSGPKDKSLLALNFVRPGESMQRWTKMTTVSIVKVPEETTDAATRGVIARVRAKLGLLHAKIATFETSSAAPTSAYFEFTAKNENDVGIAYSPHPGFVTVVQLEARKRGAISAIDIAELRHIVGKDR
jgi:hypothetical protein